ncbi:hypothetical protein ACIHFD_36190 [Nonomuraea sp. NPDC051941]|uniref:hypothetical protein n=1 Tax=Nonomuraea sp. NPDC051941 TaxID=3364373 RepID=UPI0037C75D65
MMQEMRIDTDLLGRLLDVPENPEEGADWALVRAARVRSWSLPALPLSALENEGHQLGTGSRDELRRIRDRRGTYAGILVDVITAEPATRVIKGLALAELYPAGLVRPVGDLDLFVPDEAALWRVVGAVVARHPVQEIGVSLYGRTDRHMLVSLLWPAADPALEPSLKVEVCTAVFAGNRRDVGTRATVPEHPVIANLLAVAEERFQRPFEIKDVVDVIVADRHCTGLIDQIAAAAGQFHLAPELSELLDLTRRHAEIGPLGEVADSLHDAVVRERRRRREWTQPLVPTGVGEPARALMAGRPVGGLLLEEQRWHADMRESLLHPFDEGCLLRTPVGTYLLVDHEIVTHELYERALVELERLERG